jgi:predicted DNA-binding transcriptional regulator YafY
MLRVLSSRAMTLKDLADEFGISRRQVYRELDRIQEEGHPLEQSDGEGERTWQLPLGYKGLPPVTVSPYELMALHFAKRHLDYLAGTPLSDDLGNLIKKVEVGLPHKVFDHLARINQVFLPRYSPVRDYAEQKTILKQLPEGVAPAMHRRPPASQAGL